MLLKSTLTVASPIFSFLLKVLIFFYVEGSFIVYSFKIITVKWVCFYGHHSFLLRVILVANLKFVSFGNSSLDK